MAGKKNGQQLETTEKLNFQYHRLYNTVDYTFECSSYFSSWNDKKEDFIHDISVISIGHKQIHVKYRLDVVGPERQYGKKYI